MHWHIEIGLHTPASVHDGTWRAIGARRHLTLDRDRPRHPLRPLLDADDHEHHNVPKEAWINRPTIDSKSSSGKTAPSVTMMMMPTTLVDTAMHHRCGRWTLPGHRE